MVPVKSGFNFKYKERETVFINRKSISPRTHGLNVEQIFKECRFEGAPNY
jgi:hypothetical protein